VSRMGAATRPPRLAALSQVCAIARASSSNATAMTTTEMYRNNDTLGERLRPYVEENFHNA
jgi:hypothetical protein